MYTYKKFRKKRGGKKKKKSCSKHIGNHSIFYFFYIKWESKGGV